MSFPLWLFNIHCIILCRLLNMCGNYYKCKKFCRAWDFAQQQSPSLCSLNHCSENPEALLFHSGIKTHHIEGTRETGFLRHFLCAVVILKHVPKCSFRKHVNFFSTLMKGKLCWSWGLILLNIFINNLSHGLRCALLASAGDTELVEEQGLSLLLAMAATGETLESWRNVLKFGAGRWGV